MGIPGLTTYVAQRSDICFQFYELSETFLVIDGNSLSSQLYCQLRHPNSCFGGDYDAFAHQVSNFFDELLQCQVTPLVIIDGGAEDKKLKTIMDRTRDRIVSAANLNPQTQQRTRLFPLLLKEVFREVIRQKHIKYSQALFEADDDLASVAKLLNCPVLSYDSDFYVFDVKYIPFPSLERGLRKKPNGPMAKRCKLYQVDNFLRIFPQMDRTLMPMAAALLGNDYVKRSVFKDFFSTLRLPRASKRRYNEMQRRIEAIFYFLQKNTLNSAITKVLSKIKPEHRDSVCKVLEMIINGYLLCTPTMLGPLGFEPDEISTALRRVRKEPFKYVEVQISQAEEPKSEDESDLEFSESTGDETRDGSPPVEVEQIDEGEKKIRKILPKWFVEEFNAGNFPSYFMDMLSRQFYVCPVQVEDFQQHTCMTIGLKLIKVIFGLLSKGTTNKRNLRCFMRGKGKNTETKELMCDSEEFPELQQLRTIPMEQRKSILDKCLGVTNEFLSQFPPGWRLYIATLKYWIDEAEAQFRTNCHLYSLIICLFFHIIDRQIGYFRSEKYFSSKLGNDYQTLKNAKRQIPKIPDPISIYEAFQKITYEDCLMAAPFYIENFEIHKNVLMNPKKFNISIVHAFSLFQNCLRHSSHLNSLLGCPYLPVQISQMFNGTLLYNLYTRLKAHNDLKNYVGTVIFGDSPLLSQLFVSIENALLPVCSKAFENTVNSARRRKNKRNKPSTSGIGEIIDIADVEDDDEREEEYCDPGNRYALLKTRQ